MKKKVKTVARRVVACMLCLIVAASGLIAASPIKVEAAQTNEPRWVSDPSLQNLTPLRGPNQSNGALVAEIFQFLMDYAHEAPWSHGGIVEIPGEGRGVANIDMRLSNLLTEHIRRGWQNDTFWTPFNDYYFNIILDNTHFALYAPGGGFVPGPIGFYLAREFDSHVVANVRMPNRRFNSPVGAGHSWRRQFPEVNSLHDFAYLRFEDRSVHLGWYQQHPSRVINHILHEFGHALGLGESLTNLFVNSLFRGYFPIDLTMYCPDDVRGRAPRNLFAAPQLGYSILYVETLLNRMESQGRGEDFWRAAFHSNEALRELWDAELGHIVSYNDLWTLKNVNFLSLQASSPGFLMEDLTEGRTMYSALANRFNNVGFTFTEPGMYDGSTGREIIRKGRVSLQFESDWIVMTSPRSSAAERNAATMRFNYILGIYLEVAREHSVQPKEAVLTHAIRKQNRIIDNVRPISAASGQTTILVPSWNWPAGTWYVTLSIYYQNLGGARRNLATKQAHVSEFPFALTLEGTGTTTITVYSIENGVSTLRHADTVSF